MILQGSDSQRLAILWLRQIGPPTRKFPHRLRDTPQILAEQTTPDCGGDFKMNLLKPGQLQASTTKRSSAQEDNGRVQITTQNFTRWGWTRKGGVLHRNDVERLNLSLQFRLQ